MRSQNLGFESRHPAIIVKAASAAAASPAASTAASASAAVATAEQVKK